MNNVYKTALLAALLSACNNQAGPNVLSDPADTVFTNGKIYTLDDTKPWVEAVALKDGKIIEVGTSDAVKSQIGERTQLVDLGGRMAMPGINDAHAHMYGGLKEIYQCLFSAELSPDEIRPILEDCVSRAKPGEFVMGGYWASSFFDKNDIPSPRGWLDDISSGIPIILADDSGHNSWANTAALDMVGFNAPGLEIAGGTIVLGADGKPNGMLLEAPSYKAEDIFNKLWSEEQEITGLKHTLSLLAKYGITGLKDAATYEKEVKFLHKIDKSEGLSAYIVAAQRTFEDTDDKTDLDFNHHEKIRDTYRSENLDTAHIKLYLDGVPTSSRTAAMMEDYAPDAAHPNAPATNGVLHLDPENVNAFVTELDKRGFVIKIHAGGDRSVHVALNAFEAARKANGSSGKMHEIAHAGFIVESDLPRLAKLNVSPDISPYLWFPSPVIENVRSVVTGEQRDSFFPNRTFMNAGATITAGSDWPSVSPTPSPWPGIEATISRKNPYGKAEGVYSPEERLTLEETLQIFTINGAKSLLIDDRAGAIKTGYDGNLIVLNHNLFEIPVEDISETQVEQTWYRGKLVHGEVSK